jgi:hypothetical protein
MLLTALRAKWMVDQRRFMSSGSAPDTGQGEGQTDRPYSFAMALWYRFDQQDEAARVEAAVEKFCRTRALPI